MFVRGTPCSSCICVIQVVKERHKAFYDKGALLGIDTCSAISPVAFLTEYDKGKPVTHPFSNYTVVMFVQGYVTVFLDLCNLGSKGTPQRLLHLTAFLRGKGVAYSSQTVLHNVSSLVLLYSLWRS